jgi:hypothetical protein
MQRIRLETIISLMQAVCLGLVERVHEQLGNLSYSRYLYCWWCEGVSLLMTKAGGIGGVVI